MSHPNRLSILIAGAAGSGIKTLEMFLSHAFKESGFFLFSTKEYMSRVRGGSNSTLLSLSQTPVCAPVWKVDICIVLNNDAYRHVAQRLTEDTLVIGDAKIDYDHSTIIQIPMQESAKKHGDIRYANSYVAGFLYGLLGLDSSVLKTTIKKLFTKSSEENTIVMLEGVAFAKTFSTSTITLSRQSVKATSPLQVMDGTTASGFGFLAGGCNFITSYPMSPSTGVFTFMASMVEHFDIVQEQSEDEIASLNMVLGAWYGGARAMTTTSGGGFALMGEALSLSGMSETPAVIYLAQRPGPATGLPTRTEQGDLNLALYIGHGDFGRIILAPGDLQECIELGVMAFDLADRIQMPVIYISDQYLADSTNLIETPNFSDYKTENHFVETAPDYVRYALEENGISPRGIPGYGEGIVVSDGHEHDQRGQITESRELRNQMVQKRVQKVAYAKSFALPPKQYGEGEIAIIGWGSTKGVIAEVLERISDKRLFQIHFSWVHPLNLKDLEILKSTKANIVIENNATGQFSEILKSYNIVVKERILQVNGFAFFADQLEETLKKVLKEFR